MLKLKIIIRSLINRKLSTAFALISFTIAFCCAILVYLFVTDELAFDKYNTNYHQIYWLDVKAKDNSSINCSFPGPFNNNLVSVSGVQNLLAFR